MRAVEISSILFVVWLTFVFMLFSIDVYIVPFQFPLVGYMGRVITGIIKAVIGVGLFGIWLFLWNFIVKRYFKRAVKTKEVLFEG